MHHILYFILQYDFKNKLIVLNCVNCNVYLSYIWYI